MDPIILSIIVVTVIGLIGAVILVAASIFMYVPVDERVVWDYRQRWGNRFGGAFADREYWRRTLLVVVWF